MRPWPGLQHRVQVPGALGRSRDQVGLGSRWPRGALHATAPDAARVSPTRTRSASTIATWTSSGSIPLNRLCPMDCPATEDTPAAGGPQRRFRGAHSPPSGRCAVLVWRATTPPVSVSAPEPWLLAGTQGPKNRTKERQCWPAGWTEARIRGG